jgi:hypothetical protein
MNHATSDFARSLAAVAAGLTVLQACSGATWEGTDDFSGGLAQWDPTYQHIDNPSDGFFVTGGHLQFIKTLTTTNNGGSGALLWLRSLPFSTNWTLTVDAHLNPNVTQVIDKDIKLDVDLYNNDPLAQGAVRFRIGFVFGMLGDLFGNHISIDGPDPTNMLGADIALGMTYDSATKQVTSFYYPLGNPSSLVTIGTTNVSAWPGMRLVLYGTSEYWAVSSGDVWLDNFSVYGTPSGATVSIVKAVRPSFKNLTLGRNYQLQVSGDMNTWTNQGTAFVATNFNVIYPQYWDVDNWDELFFRLQVAP